MGLQYVPAWYVELNPTTNVSLDCVVVILLTQLSNLLTKQAEIDRRKGMGVMLFHFGGTYDNLVQFFF